MWEVDIRSPWMRLESKGGRVAQEHSFAQEHDSMARGHTISLYAFIVYSIPILGDLSIHHDNTIYIRICDSQHRNFHNTNNKYLTLMRTGAASKTSFRKMSRIASSTQKAFARTQHSAKQWLKHMWKYTHLTGVLNASCQKVQVGCDIIALNRRNSANNVFDHVDSNITKIWCAKSCRWIIELVNICAYVKQMQGDSERTSLKNALTCTKFRNMCANCVYSGSWCWDICENAMFTCRFCIT